MHVHPQNVFTEKFGHLPLSIQSKIKCIKNEFLLADAIDCL